jgi:thiol-disulfide isomerase/thioredoxin
MKNIFLLLALSLLPLAAAAQGVNFEDLSLDAALAKAKTEGKHVFIDCYTAWCSPCKLMDAQTFPLQEVGDYFAPRFISVKYNMETTDEGKILGTRFGVRAYPTFIILDGDNEMCHLFAGGTIGLGFIDKVAESFEPDKALGNLQRRYEAGERDKKLVSTYLKALKETYTRDATGLVNEFYDSLSDDEKICEECLFLFGDEAPLDSPRANFFADHLDQFRAVAGREPADEMLRRKFLERYVILARGQQPPEAGTISRLRARADSLDLSGAPILAIYETATRARIDPADARRLPSMIKETLPLVTPSDVDVLLYNLLIYQKAIWNKEELDELLSLVSNDRTRDYIRNSARL